MRRLVGRTTTRWPGRRVTEAISFVHPEMLKTGVVVNRNP